MIALWTLSDSSEANVWQLEYRKQLHTECFSLASLVIVTAAQISSCVTCTTCLHKPEYVTHVELDRAAVISSMASAFGGSLICSWHYVMSLSQTLVAREINF